MRIFEPRYLDMVSSCLRNERPFGVCLIRSGSEVGDPAEPHRTGTLARIVDWDRDDRGILTIAAVGETRFRIVETRVAADRLLLGRCEPVAETRGRVPAEYEPLARLARTLTERFAPQYRHVPPPPHEESAEAAPWTGYRLAEILPIPMPHRQHLLEMDDPVARLRRIDRVVALMAEGGAKRRRRERRLRERRFRLRGRRNRRATAAAAALRRERGPPPVSRNLLPELRTKLRLGPSVSRERGLPARGRSMRAGSPRSQQAHAPGKAAIPGSPSSQPEIRA